MNNAQLSKLLENYVHGTCTDEEVLIINYWYDQYQDSPDFIDGLSPENQALLKHKMFHHIAVREQLEIIADPAHQPIPFIYRWWVKYAAAVVLLLSTTFIFLKNKPMFFKNEQMASQQIRLVNNSGFIFKKVLPDQSVVYLKPYASLIYPLKFSNESRNVIMEGECFFEVTKNPKRPFIISSEHLITKVWGTSFRISDHSNKTSASVIVVSGKVSVTKKKGKDVAPELELAADELILLPRQSVTLNNDKGMLLKNNRADLSNLAMYNHLNLSFIDKDLSEIVRVLGAAFNVSFKVKDEVLNKAVMNADLTDLNLPDILEVLKTSLNLDYQIVDDTIVLTKRNNQ